MSNTEDKIKEYNIKLSESMQLSDETIIDDVISFIDTNGGEKCWKFIANLHRSIVNDFGPKTINYLRIYKPDDTENTEEWELLYDVDSTLRPENFMFAVQEFQHDELYDYPVDICRYRQLRRKPKSI